MGWGGVLGVKNGFLFWEGRALLRRRERYTAVCYPTQRHSLRPHFSHPPLDVPFHLPSLFYSRWFVPAECKLPDDLLKDNDNVRVREVWAKYLGEDGVVDPAVVLAAAKVLGATAEETRVLGFVSSILDLTKLTCDGLCVALGCVMRGGKKTLAEFMFVAIDRDGSGALDRNELCDVIRLQNMKSSSAVQGSLNIVDMADELMTDVDTDKNGLISKQEFVDAQTYVMQKLLYVEQAVM